VVKPTWKYKHHPTPGFNFITPPTTRRNRHSLVMKFCLILSRSFPFQSILFLLIVPWYCTLICCIIRHLGFFYRLKFSTYLNHSLPRRNDGYVFISNGNNVIDTCCFRRALKKPPHRRAGRLEERIKDSKPWGPASVACAVERKNPGGNRRGPHVNHTDTFLVRSGSSEYTPPQISPLQNILQKKLLRDTLRACVSILATIIMASDSFRLI
jgi:hypothetical protein